MKCLKTYTPDVTTANAAEFQWTQFSFKNVWFGIKNKTRLGMKIRLAKHSYEQCAFMREALSSYSPSTLGLKSPRTKEETLPFCRESQAIHSSLGKDSVFLNLSEDMRKNGRTSELEDLLHETVLKANAFQNLNSIRCPLDLQGFKCIY